MARKKTSALTVGRAVGPILKRLESAEESALDLLEVYHTVDYEALWKRDLRLRRAFAKKLIGEGHPIRAYELVREGLLVSKDDAHLQYLGALALARGGNIDQATVYNDRLLGIHGLEVSLERDALSLAGRLYKMQFMRARDPVRRVELARQSRDRYRESYEKSREPFPLINWATMSLLGDDPVTAHKLARKVLKELGPKTRLAAKRRDYWHFATLGEAHLILDELADATAAYSQAVFYAGENVGDIGAMRLNARLLAQRKGLKREEISLNVGSVVAFAGHMIDNPTRWAGRAPRFPADFTLERKVSEAIGREDRAVESHGRLLFSRVWVGHLVRGANAGPRCRAARRPSVRQFRLLHDQRRLRPGFDAGMAAAVRAGARQGQTRPLRHDRALP